MRIGAILTLASGHSDNEAGDVNGSRLAKNSRPTLVTLDVLGASVLERLVAKLRTVGVLSVRVLSEVHGVSQWLPSRIAQLDPFIEEWERAVSDYVEGGADVLLLARVGPYHELDFGSLLRFHVETCAPLTQVYSRSGALDIALVSAKHLRVGETDYRRQLSSLFSQPKRYVYSGYANRLRRYADLHRLMQDGLTGNCGLHPVGTEILSGVWAGSGAQIDPTALVSSPAYIGARSRIGASCTVTGTSSIERDCKIDCGTEVRGSLVLQGTYVGAGLDVCKAIARSNRLFHLDRNIDVNVTDDRLIGSTLRSPLGVVGELAARFRIQNQSGVGEL